MLKKMFLAFALAVSLMVAAPLTPASAESYYMGTYSDGSDAYLLSETVSIFDYSPLRFKCTVYYGGSYIYYRFFQRNGSPYYSNSEGYEAYVFGGESPVAANIYQFVSNNW